jgi:hypothetical protein
VTRLVLLLAIAAAASVVLASPAGAHRGGWWWTTARAERELLLDPPRVEGFVSAECWGRGPAGRRYGRLYYRHFNCRLSLIRLVEDCEWDEDLQERVCLPEIRDVRLWRVLHTTSRRSYVLATG